MSPQRYLSAFPLTSPHPPVPAAADPLQFKKLLAPGKISQTLCLGNLTDKSTYEYLRTITPDLKIVKGRYDVEATSLPLTQVVSHGSLRIGFLEGFTLVSNEPTRSSLRRTGSTSTCCATAGTHRFDAFEYMDKFFVNPGSATGAFGAGGDTEATPSFCLMDARGLPWVSAALGVWLAGWMPRLLRLGCWDTY